VGGAALVTLKERAKAIAVDNCINFFIKISLDSVVLFGLIMRYSTFCNPFKIAISAKKESKNCSLNVDLL
jgi:hypothetical protein